MWSPNNPITSNTCTNRLMDAPVGNLSVASELWLATGRVGVLQGDGVTYLVQLNIELDDVIMIDYEPPHGFPPCSRIVQARYIGLL